MTRSTQVFGIATVMIAASVVTPRADVVDVGATGFTVTIVRHVAAPPANVFATAVAVGTWWGSDHTFSGVAANLKIDPRPGGCWCEQLLNGGGVRHMEVVYLAPGKTLVMHGGIGPLQSMAIAGSMVFQFAAAEGGTRLTVSYAVVGYRAEGLNTLAPIVDKVLTGQITRLKNYAEHGAPTKP